MTEPGTAIPEEARREAAQIVKDLFGQTCTNGRMGVTLDYVPCGRCHRCTRDWTPEAGAILAAALPHLGPVVHADTDETERLRAELDRKGELLENRDDLLRDLRAEVAALRDQLAAVEERHQKMRSALSFVRSWQDGVTGKGMVYADDVLAILDVDLAAARPVPPVQEQP